jgi:hypothetical protein
MTAQPPYLDDPDALVTAADQGHYEFVRALIASGADPNMSTAFGDTPLIAAARHGHDAIIELLLAHGADVHFQDRDGDTALSVAIHHGRESTVALLKDQGARESDGPSAKQLMMEALRKTQQSGSGLVPASVVNDPFTELQRLSDILAHKQDGEGVWRLLVESGRAIVGADGCTLYLVRDGKLHVEILLSHSLGLTLDASEGRGAIAEPMPIYLPEGSVDETSLAAVCAASCQPVNVADVRDLPSWSRSQRFDEKLGYNTVSVLTVPVMSRGAVIGVLQFINAMDSTGRVGPFSHHHETIAQSVTTLMSLAQLVFNLC